MTELMAELYDKDTSQNFYDERFKSGYMDEWPPEKKQRVIEVIRELDLPKVGEALDFGCGNGVFTDVIRQALPGWHVYGMDFSTVAVQGAKAKYPDCTFFTPADKDLTGRKYDFLFTHHVLEHVYNLDEVWQEIVGLLKPGASVLHILPCGNEGSLEHEICQLRVDGINPDMEGRFFFEDEGHVRRVSTERMLELAAPSGLELAKEYYANQYYGAIDWITESGADMALTLTEPRYAKDAETRAKLVRIRRKLRAIILARSVIAGVRALQEMEHKTLRNWAGLIARLPLFPVCRFIDRRVKRKADAEWRQRKKERNGSEMYLHFKRTG